MRGCAAIRARSRQDDGSARDDAGGHPDQSPPREVAVFSAANGILRCASLRERGDELVPVRLGVRDLDVGERACAQALDTLAVEEHELPRLFAAERDVGEQPLRRGYGVAVDRARHEVEFRGRERLEVGVAPALSAPRRPAGGAESGECVQARDVSARGRHADAGNQQIMSLSRPSGGNDRRRARRARARPGDPTGEAARGHVTRSARSA
jgi:hypothetical protein